MRLGAFDINLPTPELKEPHMLAVLQPWIDASSVGTLVLSWLETHFEAEELARLRKPGDFFDFTRYRPNIYVEDGQRKIEVPNTYVTYGKQLGGTDFLFLHLLEPHSHAEAYIDSILRLIARVGVKRYCLLGSMYDYVPHTRPLIVTGGAVGTRSSVELERLGIESSNYQGPTSITSVISQRAADAGIETMSLLVHLPQYTELDEDYMGAVRLMEVLGSLYDMPPDKDYVEKAKQQLEGINIALDKNPQLNGSVKELETQYEARTRSREEQQPPRLSPEVEKFLSEIEKRLRED
jgi:predicted ATP-grasp superfamily ATP-dependent carboligase